MRISLFWRKFLAISLSIIFLSIGWLGGGGGSLLVGLVPLLWISAEAEDDKQGWWSTFRWALFNFVGWNLATIWWIGGATPVGPFAATVASSLYSMLAFMIYHTISKRAPQALAYTALVSLWIAFEYNYTVSEFSWPWLLLGNGFSNTTWAVQWYEFTGIFGGSLWVLISNILIFEAVRRRGGYLVPMLFVAVPVLFSLYIYCTFDEGDGDMIEVSVIQPNTNCYDKSQWVDDVQEANLMELLREVPETSQLILMPETTLPRYYWEHDLHRAPFLNSLASTLADVAPNATLVCGGSTMVLYNEGEQTQTARPIRGGRYYDIFNSAIALDKEGVQESRHKARLVIGVENTPTWIFEVFKFFVIEIGDAAGQLGLGTASESFELANGDRVGVAICYEGLYGDHYSGFVRDGAEVMSIISNDGWWGDTPGHRHLYTFSSLRAIETRRAIARSANTGTSGFINARGESLESMGWDQRGVMTHKLRLNDKVTIYSHFGDYIGRLALFIAVLSLLYYISYRVRKRHYLN